MTCTTQLPAPFSVVQNGRKLTIEHDGFIPQLVQGSSVQLIVRTGLLQSASMDTSIRYRCFTVDAEKQITALESRRDVHGEFYYRSITVPERYKKNHLRLLMVAQDGRLWVREIAIVGQGKKFFLTMQTVYTEQCFRRDLHQLIIPKFTAPFAEKPWPEFVDFVRTVLGDLRSLPFYSAYRPAQEDAPQLGAHQARVQWYNIARGLGMVKVSSGDLVLVRSSQIPQNGTRLRALENGQIIRFGRMLKHKDTDQFVLHEITYC